jgi:trigger factor
MTIEVEAADGQKMLQKAAKKLSREVRIPGFRPGKAPYNTIIRRFGLEVVQQEALEDSVEKLIQDGLSEANLRPSAQISLDSVNWEPLTLKIKVPGPPMVDLGDYRSQRLEAKPVEVSAEEVEKELIQLQEQQATWVAVERPTQLNDLITMSVVETAADEKLAEHDSIDYVLAQPEATPASDGAATTDEAEAEAPSPPFRPDLTTPLLGLSAGEEKSFTVDYPADASDERYAGKTVTFTVKVSAVKERELDPLDDAFAQSISDFATLAELKADIEKRLRQSKERRYNQELGQQLLDKLIEGAVKIEWPLAMEEEAIDDELHRLDHQFERSGLNLESYLQIQSKSKEAFREELRTNVSIGLKRSIALGEVARLERLTINNSEILAQAKSIADSFGGSEQIWQNLIRSQTYQNRLATDLLSSKVLARLAEIAKGQAPDLETEATDPAEPVEAQKEGETSAAEAVTSEA